MIKISAPNNIVYHQLNKAMIIQKTKLIQIHKTATSNQFSLVKATIS